MSTSGSSSSPSALVKTGETLRLTFRHSESCSPKSPMPTGNSLVLVTMSTRSSEVTSLSKTELGDPRDLS